MSHSAIDCKTAKDRIKLKCFFWVTLPSLGLLAVRSMINFSIDSLINNSCARFFSFNYQTVNHCFFSYTINSVWHKMNVKRSNVSEVSTSILV